MLGVAALTLSLAGCAGAPKGGISISDSWDTAPPLHPGAERVALGARAPRCQAALDSLTGPGSMTLSKALVTRSHHWGLVLRADLREGPDASSLSDTRFVCAEAPAPARLVVTVAPRSLGRGLTPPLP